MKTDLELARLQLSRSTNAKKKSQFGQFLTPERTATFMAGLFPPGEGVCRLLDAGAGIGSLSSAFLERWHNGTLPFSQIEVNAFEIDATLHATLGQSLAKYSGDAVDVRIDGRDFIHAATDSLSGGLFSTSSRLYTHAILNPPYKKIDSASSHRLALRRVGIETVNLYSAFVALSVALVAPGGHVVAIIPRSFCNGPYYRPFRDFLLERTAIRHVHLFESRTKAFKDDGVLQENIIIHLERGGKQGPVTVSTSTDDTFSDLVNHPFPFERIVSPADAGRFIHIPTSPERGAIEISSSVQYTLADLGIQVSTGPVVDFRLKNHLRHNSEPGTVPLLYPRHFMDGKTKWPAEDNKKPNAIHRNGDTEKWLYPNGYYCVVRRLSSKEEPRRIVASIVDPDAFGDVSALGFENHLNVFHDKKHGLPQALAHGLAVYLNTTAVDQVFRNFNGHTQVNATDLKLMKYPGREVLEQLGSWAMRQDRLTQSLIDEMFRKVAA